MRSDIGILFMVALVACGSFAAQPQEVFRNHRETVLSGDCFKIGDCYFGVGHGVVRTTQSASDHFAKEKAILDAKGNLIRRKSMEGFVWPDSIDETSAAVLSRLASNLISVDANVPEIEVLAVEKSGTNGNAYVAVVSASSSALHDVPTPSLEEIRGCLLDPHWLKSNFNRYPKELYAFYETQKKLPDSLAGIAFEDWDESQFDLFCGISSSAAVTNRFPEGVEWDAETLMVPNAKEQSGREPRWIGNLNDTIGF